MNAAPGTEAVAPLVMLAILLGAACSDHASRGAGDAGGRDGADSGAVDGGDDTTVVPVTFEPTDAPILNPERGFTTYNKFWPADVGDLSLVRARGNTLTRPYVRLDAYRTAPLPQAFLDQIAAAFAQVRQAGIKVVLRFSYNFGIGEPDATPQRIEQHLQQLAPVIAANEDVIVSLEAGFIGAWGEWHNSSNGSDSPASKMAVLDAVLAAVPASRMVAVRMPYDMRLAQATGPITSAEAFTGTARARIGSHQDCFLASDDDWGTWGVVYDSTTRTWNPSGFTIDEDKTYVAQNGLYAVVGGETCNPNSPRSDCPTAVAELTSGHWTYLNEEFEPTVLQGFRDQGCFDEIERNLGYRFELLDGSYSDRVGAGETFRLTLRLVNRGYAPMFNARPVFAVLDNHVDRYTFELPADPRRWTPGDPVTIDASVELPAELPAGTYTLGLWLPDHAPSLRDDPRYAVQLANEDVWDPSAGYNVIARGVTIDAGGSYSGPFR